MKKLIPSLILTVTLSAGLNAFAEKMDSETQNLVIDRLDQIISEMSSKDNSWTPSNIRLADLLAERARLRFMNEIEASCKGCKGSGEDRKRALKIYSMVLGDTSGEQKAVILFQMAHLNEIGGDSKKAMALYQTILDTKAGTYSQEIITRSRVALADLYFQQSNYEKAKSLYQVALKDPKVPQKAFSLFRLSWCEYNLGNFKTAAVLLEGLAANKCYDEPALLTDVLHDLITFYSQDGATQDRINKFMTLVPEQNKKEMTLLFAQETGRLGQKQASATLYKLYLQNKNLSREESLNASLALVQTSYDQGQSREAVNAFAETAAAYQKSCSDEAKCQELQKQMKRFVTELHKLKLSKLDTDLLRAYEVYAQTFPQDVQMGMLGAQVATDLNQHAKANQLYATAADQTKDAKLREDALLGEIEAAEQSQNKDLREKSYTHYLKLMPKGPKSYEVRYQLAQLSYEKKEWNKANEQFRALALEKTSQKELQKKSADLALDCLAIEKRDADIESLSLVFAKNLPQYKTEFKSIYRKAVNAQVVKVANDSKASSSDLKAAIKKNQTADLSGASDQEKILHHKNLSVLATRAQNDIALLNSYSALLSVKTLSAQEREETLARKVGYYEKKLDFKSAYQTALQMKFPKTSKAEKELRLGTLADLAGLKPQLHYNRALNLGINSAAEMSVRQRLVLLSAKPANELKKQSNKLIKLSPKLTAEAALLIYARNRSSKELSFALNNSRLKNQPAIRYIKKQYFYPQHEKLAEQISAHRLNLNSDAKMAQSIKARLKLLTKADKSLAEAVELRDFTAQIMALSTVAKENQRLNTELMQTPAPKGLTPKELNRYMSMLKKSADPYLVKARLAQGKIQTLWNQKSEWQNILRDYTKARAEVQGLIARELNILAAHAPNNQIESLIEETMDNSRASQRDLLSARDSVSDNPSDAARIEKLINLETKLGHPLMTTYLEQRLGQIQKEKSL